MLKNLQRVLLDKSIINLHALHEDAGKTWMTWIGHNATCYHIFNVLPNGLLLIFSQFGMFWGLFATSHHALPSTL